MPNVRHHIEGDFVSGSPEHVNMGDFVVTIQESGHTWGPGGLNTSWRVAEVHIGVLGVTRYVYEDGSHTYVNSPATVLTYRPTA